MQTAPYTWHLSSCAIGLGWLMKQIEQSDGLNHYTVSIHHRRGMARFMNEILSPTGFKVQSFVSTRDNLCRSLWGREVCTVVFLLDPVPNLVGLASESESNEVKDLKRYKATARANKPAHTNGRTHRGTQSNRHARALSSSRKEPSRFYAVSPSRTHTVCMHLTHLY